uniref:Uncharacterized protein n=1 Tax=Anguilla anguilla TaxID=7936 RepID=A0A0E9VB27_ANGAN
MRFVETSTSRTCCDATSVHVWGKRRWVHKQICPGSRKC